MPLFGPPNVDRLKDKRDVNGLIKALGYQKDANVRQAAVVALGQIGDLSAVEPLIAALKDGNWEVRSAAAQSLSQIGDGRAVEPLISTLRDMREDVRHDAAKSLGEIGDARAVDGLIAALQDRDMHQAAAMALTRIGAPAVGPLIAALQDDHSDVRRGAQKALDKLGWQPDQGVAGAAYWIAQEKWDHCIQIGAPAVQPLIAVLQSKDKDARKTAAGALGQIGDARAVEPLIAALQDHNVLEAAAGALGRIGDARAVGPLIARLQDYDQWVGYTLVRALGQIRAPAVEPLIVALKDGQWRVRERAADALGKIGDARAVAPLIVALKDEINSVRSGAADALGQIGDARAVAPLIALLKDEVVYRTAADALGRIGSTAVEPLIAALKDEHEGVRSAAAGPLGKIGDARAVEPLIAALKDEHEGVRRPAAWALGEIGDARAVEPLVAALRDRNEDVRSAAAQSLGEIGDARAVEPLIAALQDKDRDQRVAAAKALVSLYVSGSLDDPHQQTILALRSTITGTSIPHTDEHTDISMTCTNEHFDSPAVPVDFPL